MNAGEKKWRNESGRRPFAVDMKYKPAAFHCGLFQVYVAGRKYALQEKEMFDMTTIHPYCAWSVQHECSPEQQWHSPLWSPKGHLLLLLLWLLICLTFLDFLLSLCPRNQSNREESLLATRCLCAWMAAADMWLNPNVTRQRTPLSSARPELTFIFLQYVHGVSNLQRQFLLSSGIVVIDC